MDDIEKEAEMNRTVAEIAAAVDKSVAQLLPAICRKFDFGPELVLMSKYKSGIRVSVEAIARLVNMAPNERDALENQLIAVARTAIVRGALALFDTPPDLLLAAQLQGASDKDLAVMQKMIDAVGASSES